MVKFYDHGASTFDAMIPKTVECFFNSSRRDTIFCL